MSFRNDWQTLLYTSVACTVVLAVQPHGSTPQRGADSGHTVVVRFHTAKPVACNVYKTLDMPYFVLWRHGVQYSCM